MWFALLKNPLTKIIAEKTFGAIKHKLEKDKIVRQKELDHAANTDVQSLKSSESSLKDEYLVIILIYTRKCSNKFKNLRNIRRKATSKSWRPSMGTRIEVFSTVSSLQGLVHPLIHTITPLLLLQT